VFRVLRLSTLHSIPPEAREVKPTGARDERREDEPTERERRVAGERSSSVPFHLHSVPSFFRPVVPEEVRNRATDVRNERGREGPNDEGTKGTGERDE